MTTGRLLVLIAGVLLALCGHGQEVLQQTDPPFGPFRIGMSLDEARAALPGASWQDSDFSRITKRAFGTMAPDAVEFAGLKFSAEVHVHHYGFTWITFQHIATVPDAPACELLGTRLIAELEGRYGPFKGPEPGKPQVVGGNLNWNITHYPNGGIGVTPAPGYTTSTGPNEFLIRVGTGSTATAKAWNELGEDQPRRRYAKKDIAGFALRSAGSVGDYDDRITLGVEARYERDAYHSCNLQFTPARMATLPPPTFMDAGTLQLQSLWSISQLHILTAETAIPAEGYEATFDCLVGRTSGLTYSCHASTPPTEAELPLYDLARSRAFGYRASLDGIDRDDPIDLQTRISIRLLPTDRRPIDFLEMQQTPFTDLRWVHVPDDLELLRAYPREAKSQGQEASVHMICQVQADHSVICGGASTDDPALLPVFAEPAYLLMARYLAADDLADGRPAAGTVFRTSVAFRLAPPPAPPDTKNE